MAARVEMFGNILELLPDLVEIGVDALNARLFCMDIEEIGRRVRGKTRSGARSTASVSSPSAPAPMSGRRCGESAGRRVAAREGSSPTASGANDVPKANIEAMFEAREET